MYSLNGEIMEFKKLTEPSLRYPFQTALEVAIQKGYPPTATLHFA